MNKIAILACKYYLNDKQLDFTQLDNEKINIKACDINTLENLLRDINTRLVDRQSMALEASIEPFKQDENYKKLDKSKIGVVVGSLSAAVYPIFEYALSAAENGPNFVNPSTFPNTVANAPASRLCIWNQFRNRVISLSQGKSSGLDAIMMAAEQINEKFCDYVWAGASEENGASLMLLSSGINNNIKPIAFVKRYESRYIGNISEDERQEFINKILCDWDIDKSSCTIINSEDSALFSLEPMIDLGKVLIKISNKEINKAIIISVDSMGMLSMIEIEENK